MNLLLLSVAFFVVAASYALHERSMHHRYKKAYTQLLNEKYPSVGAADVAVEDEPMPEHEDRQGVNVFQLVQEDLEDRYEVQGVVDDLWKRAEVGRQQYGEYLHTHNGRDPIVDAYQEALDQLVYLRQAKAEGVEGVSDQSLDSQYRDTINWVIWLEEALPQERRNRE